MPQAAPAPNRKTGNPRPPRAPVISTTKSDKRSANKAHYPDSPLDRSPVLEWFQSKSSTHFMAGIFGCFLIFAFLCFRDGGFGWTSTWWLWIFVVLPLPAFAFNAKGTGISAGADWFATKYKYVKTYELAEVKVTGAAGGMAWNLALKDSAGREAGVDLAEVQRNRDLWDLVYNGILYSVQRGAKTNDKAIRKLHLR